MRRSALLLSALLAMSALLVAAAPAAARPGTRHGPIEGRLRVGRKTVRSTNWSGYAAYGTTFAQAQGSWVQPEANCASVRGRQLTLAAFWVGLDGYLSNTVEQTGTEADCEGTRPVYYAWYEFYPQRLFVIPHEVKPGDVLFAEATQGTLLLKDKQGKWEYEKGFLPQSFAFNSAEWIAEAPTKSLTDFGSVGFSGATAKDSEGSSGPIDSEAWSNDKITLVDHSGPHATVRAEPGELEAGGTAFTDNWVHR